MIARFARLFNKKKGRAAQAKVLAPRRKALLKAFPAARFLLLQKAGEKNCSGWGKKGMPVLRKWEIVLLIISSKNGKIIRKIVGFIGKDLIFYIKNIIIKLYWFLGKLECDGRRGEGRNRGRGLVVLVNTYRRCLFIKKDMECNLHPLFLWADKRKGRGDWRFCWCWRSQRTAGRKCCCIPALLL